MPQKLVQDLEQMSPQLILHHSLRLITRRHRLLPERMQFHLVFNQETNPILTLLDPKTTLLESVIHPDQALVTVKTSVTLIIHGHGREEEEEEAEEEPLEAEVILEIKDHMELVKEDYQD